MILMKIVPSVPGAFSGYEWLALIIWIGLGVVLGLRASAVPRFAKETQGSVRREF